MQQILALKFQGFALDEVRVLVRAGPRHLHDVLAQQQAMMQAKRAEQQQQIEAIAEQS